MGRYLNGQSVIQSESETVQYSLSFVGDSLKKSALLCFIFYFISFALKNTKNNNNNNNPVDMQTLVIRT